MLNLILWLFLLAGTVALIGFAWRSAMRRRGFQLLRLLESEQILRHAVDVPVVKGNTRRAAGLLSRRGTVVLTRNRLAGFAHRSRFVLVRGGNTRPGAVVSDDGWLVVRPGGRTTGREPTPSFRFRVADAEGWSREARKVLRIGKQ